MAVTDRTPRSRIQTGHPSAPHHRRRPPGRLRSRPRRTASFGRRWPAPEPNTPGTLSLASDRPFAPACRDALRPDDGHDSPTSPGRVSPATKPTTPALAHNLYRPPAAPSLPLEMTARLPVDPDKPWAPAHPRTCQTCKSRNRPRATPAIPPTPTTVRPTPAKPTAPKFLSAFIRVHPRQKYSCLPRQHSDRTTSPRRNAMRPERKSAQPDRPPPPRRQHLNLPPPHGEPAHPPPRTQ
jgi:hypothetical protein